MKKFTTLLSVLALLSFTSVPLSAEDVTENRTYDFAVDSATTYTVNDGGSYTFSGVISGVGSITKDGAGALTFSGDNSNTGALTISGGTLNMNNYGKYASLNVTSGTVNINKGYASPTNIAIPQNATVTVGSATTTATLNFNATYSLDQHNTFILYKGSTVNLNAAYQPQNFAWGGNGIIFEGGGTITGSGTWQQGALYNATVNGANAVVTISPTTLDLHQDQYINVKEASSVMNVTSRYIRGTQNNGSYGLTKNGAGRLSITSEATYSKGINVNAGTLALSGYAWTTPSLFTVKSGATLELGSKANISNLSLSGTMNLLDSVNVTGTMEVPASATGTIQIAEGKSSTVQGAFSGSGTLNKTGNGSLAFTNPSAFTGNLNVNAGTLTVAANETWSSSASIAVASAAKMTVGTGATLPALTIAGTGTTFAGSASIGGGITLSADSTLSIAADQTINVSGTLAGEGKKLTKTGTGSLNFAGTGEGIVGGTKVSAGTMSFSGSENVTFSSKYDVNNVLIVSATVANSAVLNVSESAAVTVKNGWMTIGLNGNEKGTVNVSGGNLTVNSEMVVGEAGTGILNVSGGTMNVTGNLWGSNGTGGGTVTVSGSGKLEINNANLAVRGKSIVNVEGGTFQVNNTLNVVNSIVGSGTESTINIKSGLLSTKNVNFTLMQSGIGTGTLNLFGGTLSISENVWHSSTKVTPKVNFGQGTYKQTGNGSWASTIGINFNGRNATSTADVEGGKTTIDVASGKTLTLPGTLSGVGGFEKTSTGTLTISGANTFSGGVDVLNGTLKLTGSNASVLGTGAVVVGDGTTGQSATLNLTEFTGSSVKAESLEVGSNGTIDLKFTKTTEGFTATTLDFAMADLDGTLNLTFDSGVTLSEGTLGKIFPDSTVIQGAFASVSGGNAVPYGYKLTFSATDGTVALTLVPEPSTWVLLLLGVVLFGAFEVRRSVKRGVKESVGGHVA